MDRIRIMESLKRKVPINIQAAPQQNMGRGLPLVALLDGHPEGSTRFWVLEPRDQHPPSAALDQVENWLKGCLRQLRSRVLRPDDQWQLSPPEGQGRRGAPQAAWAPSQWHARSSFCLRAVGSSLNGEWTSP